MKKAAGKYLILVPLALFLFSAERFLNRPFWFDEALTLLNFALLPLEKIYLSYVIPNNHIGYTWLLHLWYQITPSTVSPDVWCRLLSLISGGAFIVFSWSKFKRFTVRTALCCFSVSLPFVIYATSVRGYMTALFLSMVTVYYAGRFAQKSNTKNGVCFFLAALSCVSVLPSNLLVVCAAVIYAVPFFGKDFFRKKSFYLLSVLALSAFAVFWGPVLPQVIRASRLGEGWHDRFASLSAGGVTFCACFILIVCSAGCSLFFPYRNNRNRYWRFGVFLTLIPLVFITKVAPFPRVYFPFFGIFILAVCSGASRFIAYLRMKKIGRNKNIKLFFAVLALGLTLLLNLVPSSVERLSQLNGGVQKDDYFAPWYCRSGHVPYRAAQLLASGKFTYCYLSFSSDPWSVMFYSALNGVDMRKFHFDGPQGRVDFLPDGAMIVLNKNEDIQQLIKRFGGEFTVTGKTPMHTIYRYKL